MGTSPYVCCHEGCTILTDSFDRDPSTDLGCQWKELSGNWDIHDEALREQSGAGIVITTIAHDPSCVIYTRLKNITAGAEVKILVNADSAGNGHAVTCNVVADGPTGLLVSLTVDGGNTSDQLPHSTGDDVNIRVCYTGIDSPKAQLSAEILSDDWAEQYTMATGRVKPNANGYYAGFENSGGTTVEIHGFDWKEHFNTNPECECCCCSCEGKELPDTLMLIINGSPDSECPSYEIPLTRNRLCMQEWSSAPNSGPYGEIINLECRNGEYGGQDCSMHCNYALRLDGGETVSCFTDEGWGWNDWNGPWEKEDTGCTCDPLSILFPNDGPYQDIEMCGWVPCTFTYEVVE